MSSSQKKTPKRTIEELNAKTSLHGVKGLKVCVTGTLSSCTRKEFEDLLKAHGGMFSSSITSTTKLLINAEPVVTKGAESGKVKKAKEENVPIMSEAEFWERYGAWYGADDGAESDGGSSDHAAPTPTAKSPRSAAKKQKKGEKKPKKPRANEYEDESDEEYE